MYVIGVSIRGGVPMCPSTGMYVIGVSIGGDAHTCPVLYMYWKYFVVEKFRLFTVCYVGHP